MLNICSSLFSGISTEGKGGIMDYENIILRKEQKIATLILNRPQTINALTQQMTEEVIAALNNVALDDDVRVLIIGGAGRGFCSGHDVSESLFPPGASLEEARMSARRGLLRVPAILHRMDKPTIAMVHGVALGFGCDLALACDLRVASEDARFSQGFLRLGLAPGMGGAWFLPRLIGLTKAAEFLFTGDFLGAKEADRLGMLNKLVPIDKLEEETMELARRLAKGPPIAIRMAKQLMYRCLQVELEAALELSNLSETFTLLSEDYKEGEAAFGEKREAKYEGR